MIAKFRYHCENSVIAKIEIFAMHSNFSMIVKFRYHSENSVIAKISLCIVIFAMIANFPA